MTDRFHKITVEIPPEQLPKARPLWHDAARDIVRALQDSGDLTVRGAIVLLEKLGLAGRNETKGRAA